MTQPNAGKVVTFYSFKGGTGRTMALANVAWILAANGKRVLAVDWDLESPGLHRYFAPFVSPDEVLAHRGVIGLIQDFQKAMGRGSDAGSPPDVTACAEVRNRGIRVDWSGFPDGGRLDLLPAGRPGVLHLLDWDDFYEKQNGGRFFDALREAMVQEYDYALIDSRTGYSDVAAICTIQMPDVLVTCFTLNDQGIDGAARVALEVDGHDRGIRVLPVPMRIDPAEKAKADAGRTAAQKRFGQLPKLATRADRDRYWSRMYVPYQAYYNYEEILATFGDEPGGQGTMLSAYELLTAEITAGAVTSMPSMDPAQRRRTTLQFERRNVVAETNVALRYAEVDRVWAEWLTHVLTAVGVRVVDASLDPGAGTAGCRDLMIVSKSFSDADPQLVGIEDQRNALAVYVADVPPLRHASPVNSVFIHGMPESEAIDEVLGLVGHADTASRPRTHSGGPRFPAQEPAVHNLEVRNTRFTGREDELRTLRAELRNSGTAGVSGKPVALQGMGGIGKTQIALEYAHRFRSAYDVVWWISAEPVTFIDVQLADLGRELNIPLAGAAPENARVVLDALSRGNPHKRWLLVFDNAELPDRVSQFIPRGSGHVLLTSRNPSWGDQAGTVPVDVFERAESIEHFRSRVPTMTWDEANGLAEMLGDLPIAVAAAAAYLAESRLPVSALKEEIERRGPHNIPLPEAPVGTAADGDEAQQPRSVQVVWDVSLQRLRERSAAAYRLLQLCSVMGTSIALDLVYGDELAQALIPFDPSLTERMVRGRLVRELNRLALIRLESRAEREGDAPGGRISVHQVVQHAVRSRMSAQELADTRHQVHLALAAFRPSGEVEDPATWPQFRTLWPHLEISKAVECNDEAVRQLLIDRVRYLWVAGDYQRGLQRAETTEQVWTSRLDELAEAPPDSEEDRQALRRQLLHLRFNKANILRSTGRFDLSRAIDEEVLAEQRELLGDDHPLKLITAGSLAADLRGLGRYREALEQDKITYAAWQDLFGEEYPRTLTALNNLAVSYSLIGDHRHALELDRQVLEGRRNLLGERHPDTLRSMRRIGQDLRESGEYERSVHQLRTVVDRFREALSPEARDSLNANVDLAISLRSAGHLEEAAKRFDDAFIRLSDNFPYAPDTLACRLSRAVTMLGLGSEHAAAELTAVHEAYSSQPGFGPRHPHTLVCVNNLAMALLAVGEPEEARERAAETARYFAQVIGTDHPYTLAARTNLGICTSECGDHESALTIFEETARVAADVLGEDHPDTHSCLANAELTKAKISGDTGASIEIASWLAERVGRSNPAVLALGKDGRVPRVIDPLPF